MPPRSKLILASGRSLGVTPDGRVTRAQGARGHLSHSIGGIGEPGSAAFRAPRWRQRIGAPVAVAAGLVACAPAPQAELPTPPHPSAVALTGALAGVGGDAKGFTYSPQTREETKPQETWLQRICPRLDSGLDRVAARVARRRARLGSAPSPKELGDWLAREGVPQVWPQAWTLSGAGVSEAVAENRFAAFLASRSHDGTWRCGAGKYDGPKGTTTWAVAFVDSIADLRPVPRHVRAGRWIDVDFSSTSPRDAQVVVQAPAGRPLKLSPHCADPGCEFARARFLADRPGHWRVQVVSTLASGPRPALETSIWVDVPPGDGTPVGAPGEELLLETPSTPRRDIANLKTRLAAAIDRARASSRLLPLVRSSHLEAIAQRHAERMRERQQLAHDVGDGGPVVRLAAAGLDVHLYGENVARDVSLIGAHRELWGSPSHRDNLLNPRFTQLGLGIALEQHENAPDGTAGSDALPDPGATASVWVCEAFAE